MGSGHASHKGGNIKQSHDTGEIDNAASMPGDPENVLGEGEGYPFDAEEETAVNPVATERPSPSSQEKEGQQ